MNLMEIISGLYDIDISGKERQKLMIERGGLYSAAS